MKTQHTTRRWNMTLNLLTVCSLLMGAMLMTGCQLKSRSQKSSPASSNVSNEKVGVYDSRSIAIAFVNSPSWKESVQPIQDSKHQAYSQAVKDGDTQAIEELKAWGQAQQTKLHTQAFSTESVDEMLALIADRLPLIQQQVGVTRLVSMWDIDALTSVDAKEQVDVTMLLIDALEPTTTQRKAAIEIQQHTPISLAQARQIRD